MATKYKERNKAQIQTNSKGYLQYQIPVIYAQQYWGVSKQKTFSFGAKAEILSDLVNAAEVQQKLELLNQDLEKNGFNPKKLGKYKYNKKQLSHHYREVGTESTLLEVFDSYMEYRFSTNDDGTGRYGYETKFKPLAVKSPCQDLTESTSQRQIAEFVITNSCYGIASETLSVFRRAVDRAIAMGELPQNTPNVFGECLKEHRKINKSKRRQYPEILTERGFIKNQSKIAWTKEEVEIILSAWRNRPKLHPFYRQCDVKTLLLDFLFRTGMRHGEAYGLKWNAVSDNCSRLLIHKSYASKTKALKCTKTGKSREIEVSLKVQKILKTVHEFNQDMGLPTKPDSYVFLKPNSAPFSTSDMCVIWRGAKKKPVDMARGGGKWQIGIVPQLVIDGKLNNYIDMYSTRRTYVSLQAQHGVGAATVAAYVGDNVETIFKHYYSGQENFRPEDLF